LEKLNYYNEIVFLIERKNNAKEGVKKLVETLSLE